ncbi:MAG: Dabb family protein [Methylomonas sp.]
MKVHKLIPLALLMAATAGMESAHAQTGDLAQHKVHHVVVVWLKQAGNENVRREYIEASKLIANLPGVLSYDIGSPAVIKRAHTSSALDESYDVAISSTYESQQAFEDFLKNPEYLRIAQQVLKPLVEQYKVYDFIE